MHIVRVPFSWSVMASEASYYGYKYGIAFGAWLVLFGKLKHEI